jgi:rhodanese-related sulfurtransferase
MALPARRNRVRLEEPQSVPQPARDQPDLVLVDTTWGKLQPVQPVEGIRTVGELELTELVSNGAALIDTRVEGSVGGSTIPGAVNIPHDDISRRADELDRGNVSIMFCNGPQCPQTPDALRSLQELGFPLDRLAYYRGGMHDWVSLAMPTQPA